MGEFDDLIEEFVTESKEHIADIEEDLIKIEADMENVDHEVINRVFRAAHSIKGSAKFLDLGNIGDLAHKMEDILNLIRSGKLIPTSEIAGPLLQAADMLKNMFEDVMASNDMDITEQVEALEKILNGDGAPASAKTRKTPECGSDDVLGAFEIDRQQVVKKLDHSQVYLITLNLDKAGFDEFVHGLDDLGEVLEIAHTTGGSTSVLFASIMEPDMIPMALQIDETSVTQILAGMLQPQEKKPQARQEKPQTKKENPQQQKSSPAETPARAKPGRAAEQAPPVHRKILSINEAEEQAKEENNSFITFSLENETYAVPIQTIEEIIGLQDISLLPNVPDFIKGVINLRGELVPIMDLRLKLGLKQKEYTPLTVFLIVRVEERVMGMVVDNVADVLVIDPRRVQKTPAFSARISTDFIEGVYKDAQNQMVILVDLPALIKPQEWDAPGYVATASFA